MLNNFIIFLYNKMCDNWEKNKLTNPFTKRKIKEDGPIYKQFKEFCKKYKDNCVKFIKNKSINPLTGYKISEKSKITEFYNKLCDDEVKISKKKAKEAKDYISINNFTKSPLQCTEYKVVKLKDHQLKVCNYIKKNPDIKGLVLFHSVGSGKTITSITIIRCILQKEPNKKVFVVTPTSLVENFNKELEKVKIKFNDNVQIISHTRFINKIDKDGPYFCKNSVIVIDEAHNFKTKINKNDGKRVKSLFTATEMASQVFLLTATPIQNDPEEFANLYAMIDNKEFDIKNIYKIFKNYDENKIKNLLKDKISYFKNNDTTEYPAVTYHEIEFYMTPQYYELYKGIEDKNEEKLDTMYRNVNLQVFYNGLRRAVNYIDENITSPKIEWTIDFVKKSVKNNNKVLIYSNWLRSGSKIIQERLDKENIEWVEINGSMTPAKRKLALTKYNGTEKNKYKDNKISVLFISSAGAEGLDLKNTRYIIILEPHWNNEKIKQVVGRGARFRSHIFLPKSEQKVDVYNLILKKPKNKKDEIVSVDEYLLEISSKKEEKINDFYEILIKSTI
jgi:superfamily II DNA/RNA helicase